MSSAVQLKLLTLLNVSAIKRPFELDVPGGHRSSPTLSRETSLVPQIREPATGTPKKNGSSSKSPSKSASKTSNGRGADGEPPKKKKKGVIFGGVIGPSGSTIKEGKSEEKKGKKNKDKKRGEEQADLDAVAAASAVKASGSTSTSTFDLVEESDSSDDDDETTPATTTSQDAFQSHFAVSPSILNDTTRESAEAHEWTSRRSHIHGLGRVVSCLPKGREDVEDQGKTGSSSRITPSLLGPYKSLYPTPSDMQKSTLHALGAYQDVYLHGVREEEELERIRGAGMLHAVNHVLK